METSVRVAEPVEKKLTFNATEEVTSDNRKFKVINSDSYSIALFPAGGKDSPEKKSRLKYNARVTLKQSGITFHMVIKELKEDGTLLAGQPGKLSNHRAVVTEWDAENEKSYERMSVPNNIYKEIIALVQATG